MFYESLGMLLQQAADVLNRHVRAEVADERARTQLDAVAALAADVGAMWPALFKGLEQENRILERALEAGPGDDDDPLARHRRLMAMVNEALATLPEGKTDAGRATRERLRRAMLAAADAQREVMDTAARAAQGPVRRI